MKKKINPKESRRQFNLKNGSGVTTYAKAEAFSKALKVEQHFWIGPDLTTLNRFEYRVISKDLVTVPTKDKAIIAEIGTTCTRITVTQVYPRDDHHHSHDADPAPVYKDFMSYNIIDALLFVSLKKPH